MRKRKNELIDLVDSEIIYYPDFFLSDEADRLFKKLHEEIDWQQDPIRLFGKTFLQPRLTALYAENKLPYAYSSVKMFPKLFTKSLLYIKEKVEKETKEHFTSCLANLYRDGQDSNGWHADDEKELGKNPVIASISLGEDRIFKFRNKKNHQFKHKMVLENGSLLLMKGPTQHFWQHEIPKTKKPIQPRINLTYRKIFSI